MRFHKGSFLFALLILMLVSLFFIVSFSLRQKDRFVPLVILTPALIMSIYCFLGEFFPKLLSRTNISVISLGQETAQAGALFSKAGKLVGTQGLLIVTGWLFGYSILVLLVGFLIATPIALFLFLKVFTDQGWLRSLVITVATWAFIYIVFELIFEYELFRGILFGEIVVL